MPKYDDLGKPFSSGRAEVSMWQLSSQELELLVDEAIDAGVNFLDHADIHGGGGCEELFGSILTPERRNL